MCHGTKAQKLVDQPVYTRPMVGLGVEARRYAVLGPAAEVCVPSCPSPQVAGLAFTGKSLMSERARLRLHAVCSLFKTQLWAPQLAVELHLPILRPTPVSKLHLSSGSHVWTLILCCFALAF